MINFLRKILLRFYIKLQNFSYKQISKLSTKINNNIHPKHEIMKYYLFFTNIIDKDTLVLDIGCGNGYLTYKISEKAKKVIGIDIDKKSIDFAKKNFINNNIEYICSDVTKYNFQEKFDFIVLSNVLEHLRKRKELLLKLKLISKYLLIRVPMLNRSWLTIYLKELGYDYRLDNTHFIEYTIESFKSEMNSASLKIIYYEIKFGEIWAKIEC